MLGLFVCMYSGYIIYEGHKVKELREYRLFIESEYGDMLALIEQEIKSLKDHNDHHEVNLIIDQLRPVVMRDEIQHASWSTRTIIMITNQITRYTMFESSSHDGFYSLYYGRTDGGTKLLFLTGRVPNVSRNRYWIVFEESYIRNKIEHTQKPLDRFDN